MEKVGSYQRSYLHQSGSSQEKRTTLDIVKKGHLTWRIVYLGDGRAEKPHRMVRQPELSCIEKPLPPTVGGRVGDDSSPEARARGAGATKETQRLPEPPPMSAQERRHILTSSCPPALTLPSNWLTSRRSQGAWEMLYRTEQKRTENESGNRQARDQLRTSRSCCDVKGNIYKALSTVPDM